MKRLMLVMFLIAIVMAFTGSVYAQTPDTTLLQNTANVTAGNVPTGASASHNTNVQRIVGAEYSVIPTDTTAAPGQTVNLIWTVVNRGNANDSFSINAVSVNEATNGGWTVNQLETAIATPFALGNAVSYTMQVIVGGAASNGAWIEFQVDLISDEFGGAANYGRCYVGDNGTVYGGDMGLDLAGTTTNDNSTLLHAVAPQGFANFGAPATGNAWVRIDISGPVLSIVKYISNVTLDGAAAPGVIPGSTITYCVLVSNTGSGAAEDVIITDTLPGNTTYVAASAVVEGYDNAAWDIQTPAANTVLISNYGNGLNTTNGGGNNGWVKLSFDVTVN